MAKFPSYDSSLPTPKSHFPLHTVHHLSQFFWRTSRYFCAAGCFMVLCLTFAIPTTGFRVLRQFDHHHTNCSVLVIGLTIAIPTAGSLRVLHWFNHRHTNCWVLQGASSVWPSRYQLLGASGCFVSLTLTSVLQGASSV